MFDTATQEHRPLGSWHKTIDIAAHARAMSSAAQIGEFGRDDLADAADK